MIELLYNQLKLIFWKINFKIKFELKITLFLILESMLYLSLLTLRTHGHCCSMPCRMKVQLNALSRSEITVRTRKLILSMCNIDEAVTEGGSKVQPCYATAHRLTAYKDAPYEENFKIELLQYWKACGWTILLLCGSVVPSRFIVIKYTRSKPRLIKNKVPQVILD